MVKGRHFHFAQNIWKKIKKYGLTKLILNNDNARRQVANLTALPLLPSNEINEAFSNVIESFFELGDKCIRLTDYVLKTYIEEPRYLIDFWSHFDLIGKRPGTNNHVEGYHGHCEIHPHLRAWIRYIQEGEESTTSRYEQEQAQQHTTRRKKRRTVNNDLRLTEATKSYFNGPLGSEDYQATLRSLSYRYIVVLDNDSNS
ncbi:unnamed protein product [Didymodactylos carnosus]|uniref:Uncharacterized protein n=1 Tax=Didymodactylos carnosus TaxID=1234261 RepID=A0A8S2WGB0_9BILA|nr:unnamed protein product [Didymodactylos carnosus]